jgi:hypothetical protein
MPTTIIIVTGLAVVIGAATGITTTNMPAVGRSAETTGTKTGAFLIHRTTQIMQVVAEVITSPTGVMIMTVTTEITGTGVITIMNATKGTTGTGNARMAMTGR